MYDAGAVCSVSLVVEMGYKDISFVLLQSTLNYLRTFLRKGITQKEKVSVSLHIVIKPVVQQLQSTKLSPSLDMLKR